MPAANLPMPQLWKPGDPPPKREDVQAALEATVGKGKRKGTPLEKYGVDWETWLSIVDYRVQDGLSARQLSEMYGLPYASVKNALQRWEQKGPKPPDSLLQA